MSQLQAAMQMVPGPKDVREVQNLSAPAIDAYLKTAQTIARGNETTAQLLAESMRQTGATARTKMAESGASQRQGMQQAGNIAQQAMQGEQARGIQTLRGQQESSLEAQRHQQEVGGPGGEGGRLGRVATLHEASAKLDRQHELDVEKERTSRQDTLIAANKEEARKVREDTWKRQDEKEKATIGRNEKYEAVKTLMSLRAGAMERGVRLPQSEGTVEPGMAGPPSPEQARFDAAIAEGEDYQEQIHKMDGTIRLGPVRDAVNQMRAVLNASMTITASAAQKDEAIQRQKDFASMIQKGVTSAQTQTWDTLTRSLGKVTSPEDPANPPLADLGKAVLSEAGKGWEEMSADEKRQTTSKFLWRALQRTQRSNADSPDDNLASDFLKGRIAGEQTTVQAVGRALQNIHPGHFRGAGSATVDYLQGALQNFRKVPELSGMANLAEVELAQRTSELKSIPLWDSELAVQTVAKNQEMIWKGNRPDFTEVIQAVFAENPHLREKALEAGILMQAPVEGPPGPGEEPTPMQMKLRRGAMQIRPADKAASFLAPPADTQPVPQGSYSGEYNPFSGMPLSPKAAASRAETQKRIKRDALRGPSGH